ncbi:sigma-70 family RNA polymerase sigma factor [Paenibacillus sp. GSMTC-2017]|uniref:sigma-70 family RNA polymerase sigma factor n=1 Tax=Paenibacillus sp. GSMTC-2017 TaxID=2794350 RepID=UPI0018D5B03B|nr:sigma-70 family RNA polymerase sigma factor [Paenibacillus sp. GSMTC-2017]MBH5316514.1 sigma-70 family RNA polymerase sigma factor [Paenibacillus sp. GSMTC-2017]
MDIHKLVKKAQKGNDKAFLELFQQYEESIYRIAYMYVKNKEDALDIVQDTAYQSFKSIGSLREPQYIKTWLFKIAINRAIYICKQRQKIILFPTDYKEHENANTCEEDIPLSVTLQQLLDDLDTNEKSVITLKYYEGYTIQAIADMLELPLGSTKTILYRGLGKLRQSLKRGETL